MKVLEKEKTGVLRHIYVVLVVLFSFVLFDASDISQAFYYISSMFGAGDLPLVSMECLYQLKSYAVILAAAVIGATPLVSQGIKKLRERSVFEKFLNAVEPVFLVLLMLVITGYIVDGSFNPFLYFRF